MQSPADFDCIRDREDNRKLDAMYDEPEAEIDPDRQRDEEIQQAWDTYESARDEKRQKDMWAMIENGDMGALANELLK